VSSSSYLAVINELTLWAAIKRARAGHRVYHFRTDPIFNELATPLARLVAWAKRRGWLEDAEDLAPDAEIMLGRVRLFGSLGWYVKVEPVVFAEMGLDRPTPDPYDLLFAMKKQTANYIADHFDVVYFAHQLREAGQVAPRLLLGDPIGAGLVEAVTGSKETISVETVGGGRWLNPLIALGVGTACLIHILRRIVRTVPVKVRRYLAVDGTDNVERTLSPVRSVLGQNIRNQVLVVFRSRQWFQQMSKAFVPLPVVRGNDGAFTVGQAWVAAVRVMKEMVYDRRWLHLYPASFVRLAKISFMRVVFDGFFNKYDCDVFFSFDEYNVDHILRTEAMWKRGIRSVCRINGVNVFKVDYAFRYIDFDSGYVISENPMRKYNGDTWRNKDAIKGFGTFGLDRAGLRRVEEPRPNDILCFAKPWFDGSQLARMMVDLGRVFPDRRVTIAAKRSSKRFGGYGEYEEIVADGPDNVVLSDENSFELILRHRYCLCSESSILAEAMELRCNTFFLNMHDDRHVLLYRDYPQICVSGVAEIVEKIQAIEAGRWLYPRASMGDLIKLSPVTIYDQIRADWGLPPYEEDSRSLVTDGASHG
jgi:hypothetical protein